MMRAGLGVAGGLAAAVSSSALAGYQLEMVDPHPYFYCDVADRSLRTRLSHDGDAFVRVEDKITVGCLKNFPLVFHGVRQGDGRVQWCLGLLPYLGINPESAYLYGVDFYTAVTPVQLGHGERYALDFVPDDKNACALMY